MNLLGPDNSPRPRTLETTPQAPGTPTDMAIQTPGEAKVEMKVSFAVNQIVLRDPNLVPHCRLLANNAFRGPRPIEGAGLRLWSKPIIMNQ